MEGIVIIGFGGHAKSIADSIRAGGRFSIIGYTDVEKRKSKYPYLGTDDELKRIYEMGVHYAALGIGFMGDAYVRDSVVNRAKVIGFHFPAIIDPTAAIAKDAQIGEGTFVGKNAVVNAEAKIGAFVIINSGAIIEHENQIEDYSHVAVGAKFCGNVAVGSHVFIGAGAIVIQGISVSSETIVGAGSVVVRDIPSNVKAYGNPCKVVE